MPGNRWGREGARQVSCSGLLRGGKQNTFGTGGWLEKTRAGTHKFREVGVGSLGGSRPCWEKRKRRVVRGVLRLTICGKQGKSDISPAQGGKKFDIAQKSR